MGPEAHSAASVLPVCPDVVPVAPAEASDQPPVEPVLALSGTDPAGAPAAKPVAPEDHVRTTQEVPAPAEPPTPGPVAGEVLFGAYLSAGGARHRTSRARRWTVTISIAVHAVLLVGGAVHSFWRVEEISAPAVPVTFLQLPVAPPPPPPPAAARRAEAPRPKAPRPVATPPPVVVQPPETPVTPPEPPPEPVATEVVGTADTDEPGAVSGGEAGGEAGGVAGGVVGGVLPDVPSPAAPPPPRPAGPSPEELRRLLARYADELFRSRIASRQSYPPEGERLGIEGRVMVRFVVDGGGRLVDVSLAAACPHEVLCEAAQQAVREAAPFPPPPPALGARVTIDLPLNYKLE